jgi:glycosyltransferase involved in cell wall biosynthesis
MAKPFLRLIVISRGLKEDLSDLELIPNEASVVVAHDGALSVQYGDQWGNGTKKLGNKKFNLGYVGQLYEGKGLEVILPLARQMPDLCFHVIGGREDDLNIWKEREPSDNLIFHGFVSPGQVPDLYREFQVLLLPPQNRVYGASGQSEISRWMSPMKMFEYMATGKPIISSNLPVLREVLTHERNALLVEPDNLDAWEKAIRRLQKNPNLAANLGNQAKKDLIENYTWEARAKKVLQGL